MQKVLITGVAGFIASHIASRFLREGYEVIGVDDLSTGHLGNVPSGVHFIKGDLANEEVISEIPGGCRKILHLAGQSSGEISFDNPIADIQKNVHSTLNLIRYGVESRVERFVYASSMSVYGSVQDKPIVEAHRCAPISCYGVGKLASEGYLRVFGKVLPYVIMRMFNVYGPGQDMTNLRQGMVSIYLSQAMRDGEIVVKGSVERFRDFIYIDDVVEAWYRAAHRPSAIGKTLNVGTGVKTSVGTLLENIRAIIPGVTYQVEGVTPGDQAGIYADTTAFRECLGIESFVKVDTGLKRFVEWAEGI